ncbi:MAG: NUDIX hydrolase [Chloroflexi bacterium]|nr:NUDIX hydrolase [Chloroflexota bacterium]
MPDSREYPLRPIPGIGVIVFDGDAVLLIQRGKPPRIGAWALPGGAIELGETIQDAARREIREECGIEINPREVVDAVDIFWRDEEQLLQYHYVIVELAADYAGGDLRAASDVMAARWLTPAEMPEYDLTADTLRVIAKARRV